MGLDYSQTQLLNESLMSHKRDAHTRRLQMCAVATGFFSALISLATFVITIMKFSG